MIGWKFRSRRVGSLVLATFSALAIPVFAQGPGALAHDLGFPRLVGYLVAGLALGPSVLDVVPPGVLQDLSMMKQLAVGLIALLAGAELRIKDLVDRYRTIAWVLASSWSLRLWRLGRTSSAPGSNRAPRPSGHSASSR